ncbi:ScyD/ScyE family protein [Chamaesiphon polymorphus]|uniref:ScyD/ScyE family protein n=1 Tax=Chamaesiphon polymorphus CCALA 037 TaxID=2107692 RepID=A0A2T1GIR8_9CYAN|nr:ScyD/ScyE family protein [Chamaesiphon polymorphus]PSB57643.1 ScyD/ScyE family protein [Chamaesiphon polymorphus CCALA 037]
MLKKSWHDNSKRSDADRQRSQQPQIEVLVSGLDSPRKLSFGPDGGLYVTEAGRGGTGASIPDPAIPGALLFYGATGAITRIKNGVANRVVTGLPSLALPDGSNAAGVSDIEFDAAGNAYAIVGLGSNPANRDNVLKVPDFSQLIGIDKFDGGASWTRLQDFGAYELANNPDGQQPDTNLFDLLIQKNTAYVVDAGGNTLLSQRAFGGEPKVEAVFPIRTATNPFGGQPIPQQFVPTSVAAGPDGALYVGQLTGFPFEVGSAGVYRVGTNGQSELYATCFTSIVDLAFDRKGGLYVLEYDSNGLLNPGDAGALIYLAPDGKTRTTVTDKLINPNGLEFGANGDIYISNNSNVAGQGEVLRLSFDRQPKHRDREHFHKKNFHDCQPNADTLDDIINFGGSTSTYPQDRTQMSIASDVIDYYGSTDTRSRGAFQQSDLLSNRGTFDYSLNTSGGLDPFAIAYK